MVAARDYATLLKVVEPRNALATKQLYRADDGSIGKIGFDKPWLFDARTCDLDDIDDVEAMLHMLDRHPRLFVIRGKPYRDPSYGVYRRLGVAFDADPVGHHWLMIDVDELPMPVFIDRDDRDIALGYLVRLLPAEFHNATHVYQWSSGAGLDGWATLRVHLWFWLDRKVIDRDLVNWARMFNLDRGAKTLDPAVYVSVQPNYTAGPVLGAGVDDPLSGEARIGLKRGVVDEVPIVLPVVHWEAERARRARAEHAELIECGLAEPGSLPSGVAGNRFEQFLADMGDDGDGFHGPITSAIASWVTSHGEDDDDELKRIIRARARAALCTDRTRDLDHYLSDATLDDDIVRARGKYGGSSRVGTQQREQESLKAAIRSLKTKKKRIIKNGC